MTQNQLAFLDYQERARHNAATEAETIRANDETARSNLAKESETHRANTVREEETEANDKAKVKLGYKELAESKRTHVVQEDETHRANKARERENKRHNKATEEVAVGALILDQDEFDQKKWMDDVNTVLGGLNATSNFIKAMGSLT